MKVKMFLVSLYIYFGWEIFCWEVCDGWNVVEERSRWKLDEECGGWIILNGRGFVEMDEGENV